MLRYNRRLSVLTFLLCAGLSCLAQTWHSCVKLETTMGDIIIALYDETPVHRDNFLRLVRSGYYDGLLFHRAIKNFVVQGGDPDSRQAVPGQYLGEGGPGYTLPAEFRLPQLYHCRGAVAAARESDDINPEQRSSGSQFYIVWGKRYGAQTLKSIARELEKTTHGKAYITDEMAGSYTKVGGAPHLDGQYTVFGKVLSDLEIVEEMQRVRTDLEDRPLEDIRILKATVLDGTANKVP